MPKVTVTLSADVEKFNNVVESIWHNRKDLFTPVADYAELSATQKRAGFNRWIRQQIKEERKLYAARQISKDAQNLISQIQIPDDLDDDTGALK